MSAGQISLVFTLFGIIGLISQVVLVGLITKTFGVKKTFMTSLLGVAISFIAMYFTTTVPAFVIANVVLGFVNAYVQPLSLTILSEETDPKEQGEMQGINASYMSIGQIIGPILAGVAATFSVGSPFIGAGILTFICYFLSFEIFAHLPKKTIKP